MAYLYVDTSQMQGMLDDMKLKLTEANFDRLMRRTMHEVGSRCKPIIREAIQNEYYAPTGWVNQSIKRAIIEGGGSEIRCKIPVVSERGQIGKVFAANGGAYGWPQGPYKITALIVKGETTVLPSHMSHQGGQPPYRNLGARTYTRTITDKNGNKKKIKVKKKDKSQDYRKNGKKGSGFLTRSGKSRFPVRALAGLAVPQMPINRSRTETENRMLNLAMNRAEHNFSHMFGG